LAEIFITLDLQHTIQARLPIRIRFGQYDSGFALDIRADIECRFAGD
jgi:hypothetical protein